jgi:hypothetical protein
MARPKTGRLRGSVDVDKIIVGNIWQGVGRHGTNSNFNAFNATDIIAVKEGSPAYVCVAFAIFQAPASLPLSPARACRKLTS